MKTFFARILAVCACLLAIAILAGAQNKSTAAKRQNASPGVAVLKGTGKAAVIVVGSAAKAAWKTSKFTVKYVAKPVAVAVLKPFIVHAAPAASKYALKYSAKYLLPYVVKLSLL